MIVTGINLIGLITMLTGYFGIRKRNYPVLSAPSAGYQKFYSNVRNKGQTLLAIMR